MLAELGGERSRMRSPAPSNRCYGGRVSREGRWVKSSTRKRFAAQVAATGTHCSLLTTTGQTGCGVVPPRSSRTCIAGV